MEKLRNRLYLCKHNGECWKCAAEITLLVKTWLLTHARDGVRLASDQTKARMARGWMLLGELGPRHPGWKNHPNKACLFPFVRDEMIRVLWKTKQLRGRKLPAFLWSHGGSLRLGGCVALVCGLHQKKQLGLDACGCFQFNFYSFHIFLIP